MEADTGWMERGACVGTDPDLFFPERGVSTKAAKDICAGCQVMESCREFGLASSERFGIWGGLSERDRRRVRRQRALVGA